MIYLLYGVLFTLEVRNGELKIFNVFVFLASFVIYEERLKFTQKSTITFLLCV